MKNFRSLFLLLQLLSAAFFISGLHAEVLRAVTWNIEWYPGGRPNASKGEQFKQAKVVAKVLGELNPEIFLAQEITDPKAFGKLVKSIPGMNVHVVSNFPEREGGKMGAQQCAIASKLKAHSAWFETFKPAHTLPHLSRGFAFAALEHPEGGLMMFYSVHLKSNRGSETPEGEKDVADTRSESVRQIIAHKAEMEKKFAGQKIVGWLVAGDFNSNHDGQFPMCTAVRDLVAAGFHNTWDGVPRENRLTWRNGPFDKRFKPTTFDYMLTTGFKETQAVMIQGIPTEVSDHAAVMLTLSK